MKYND